jgi:flagellar protein FlbD
MITLTRLSGSAFVLNSDLIERIDQTPDSVVTLIDGKKYVVTESLDEIIERVRAYRSEVVAFGSQLAERPEPAEDARLDPVPRAGSGGRAAVGHDRPTIVPLVRPHGEH